jgi:hypothetical protein
MDKINYFALKIKFFSSVNLVAPQAKNLVTAVCAIKNIVFIL